MEFYQAGRSEGGSFDDGIEAALQRILADPEFVYRGEREPAGLAVGRELPHQRPGAGLAPVVLPVEQHSRRRADRRWPRKGELRDPAVLEKQVRRMLADPKSEALDRATSPASGWACGRCDTERAGRQPVPGLRRQPARTRIRREIELFFDSIVREDRSVLDLLTADYTFVNERLAKHYGIPNVYGAAVPPRDACRRRSTCAAACWARARC